jgi:chemotaxis protein methyltransferase CheR
MAAPSISPEDFKFLSDMVLREAAIVLEAGKEYLVISRLDPVARKEGIEGISSLVKELRMNPRGRLRDLVVDAMTTNETLFFRDAHPFDAFAKKVIPDLMKARASTRSLNIWCAAASTGQEPYSIAMLLRESFPELVNWRLSIYATDISTAALNRAKAGRYSQLEVGRGLPARYMVKCFTRVGTEWEINPEIKSMVRFDTLNLAGNWPAMTQFDVIFIRNVLIYFSQDTKRQIISKAVRSLRPDGALILGSTESLLGMDSEVDKEQFEKTTYYRPKASVATR